MTSDVDLTSTFWHTLTTSAIEIESSRLDFAKPTAFVRWVLCLHYHLSNHPLAHERPILPFLHIECEFRAFEIDGNSPAL
jgi:hypothetical protein